MTISHNTVYFVVGTRVTIARSHGDLRGEPDGCLECVDEGRDDDMVRHQYRSPSDGWVRNEAEEDDDRLTEERIREAPGSTRTYLNGKKVENAVQDMQRLELLDPGAATAKRDNESRFTTPRAQACIDVAVNKATLGNSADRPVLPFSVQPRSATWTVPFRVVCRRHHGRRRRPRRRRRRHRG